MEGNPKWQRFGAVQRLRYQALPIWRELWRGRSHDSKERSGNKRCASTRIARLGVGGDSKLLWQTLRKDFSLLLLRPIRCRVTTIRTRRRRHFNVKHERGSEVARSAAWRCTARDSVVPRSTDSRGHARVGRFRRAPVQSRMRSMAVIVTLEIEELHLQIRGRPEQHAVQTFAPNGANQPFNEGMGERHVPS